MKKVLSMCFAILLFVLPFFSIDKKCVEAEDFSLKGVKSYCLMDYDSGLVLAENNSDEKLPVASMVKLMTLLLVFEKIDDGELILNEQVFSSEKASGMGGSQVFLDANENYVLEDLLKSVIMASANDASVALAEHIAGNENSFVKKMNEKAKQLGMANTNYVNCTGLPVAEQFSSAHDTCILNRELLKHKIYHNYSTIWMDKLVHPSGRETSLVNTNKLIRYFKDCDGGKTGSTDEAGYCLSATAKRNNMRLISTVCGATDSKTRFNECGSLLNYGFANFKNKKLIDKNTFTKEVNIKRSMQTKTNLIPKEDFYAIIKNDEKNTSYSFDIDCKETIIAPISKGKELGKIIVYKDGEPVKEIELICSEDVKKISFEESLKKISNNWSF